jgi:hypothetical protein
LVEKLSKVGLTEDAELSEENIAKLSQMTPEEIKKEQ